MKHGIKVLYKVVCGRVCFKLYTLTPTALVKAMSSPEELVVRFFGWVRSWRIWVNFRRVGG